MVVFEGSQPALFFSQIGGQDKAQAFLSCFLHYFLFCIPVSRLMGRKGWSSLPVPNDWVQVIRGLRHPSEKWPMAGRIPDRKMQPRGRWRRDGPVAQFGQPGQTTRPCPSPDAKELPPRLQVCKRLCTHLGQRITRRRHRWKLLCTRPCSSRSFQRRHSRSSKTQNSSSAPRSAFPTPQSGYSGLRIGTQNAPESWPKNAWPGSKRRWSTPWKRPPLQIRKQM